MTINDKSNKNQKKHFFTHVDEIDITGAHKYLLERYEGFSKQRQQSLRKIIENIRHTHGTNMSRHVDKFERINKPSYRRSQNRLVPRLRDGENI